MEVVVVERGPPGHETKLVEGQALLDPHRERERYDLEIQPAAVAGGDLVEAVALVGDHPGEDVEPAGRALRIRPGPDGRREGQFLDQWDQVRTVGLEHRAAVAQVELVDDVVLDLGLDRLSIGKEAAADPVRNLPETQVETRRLDARLRDPVLAAAHVPRGDGAAKELAREDAVGVGQRARARLLRCRPPWSPVERTCRPLRHRVPPPAAASAILGLMADRLDQVAAPSVVFLCTGNAARSVIAGAALAQHLPSAVIATAGTFVVEGQPMSFRTRAALASVGLPVPDHRSRQAVEHELRHADLIVGLAPEHVAWIRRELPGLAARTATLRRLCRDLQPAAEALAARVAALHLDQVELEDWEEIVDPGGGDTPEFEQCAREIVELMPVLAAALTESLDVLDRLNPIPPRSSGRCRRRMRRQ